MSNKEGKVKIPDPEPGESNEMPVVPFRVLYSDLPFYSDPACNHPVPGAKIVVLQVLDPDEPEEYHEVVPALKSYRPGQLVTWSLNNKKLWDESWFRNPETGQIEQAWTTHVEFDGEIISQSVVKENQEKLDEIERRLSARTSRKEGKPLVN